MTGWRKVCSRRDVKPGEPFGAKLDGTPIGIFQVGDALHAVHDVCMHEYALLSQFSGVEKFFTPRAKRPAEPLIQGQAKPHLRTLEKARGNVAGQNQTKNPLSLSSMDLEVQRQPPCKFHKPIIQEWHSGFKTRGHTGAIELRQNVFRQIIYQVHIHHTFGIIHHIGPQIGVCKGRQMLDRFRNQIRRPLPLRNVIVMHRLWRGHRHELLNLAKAAVCHCVHALDAPTNQSTHRQ